MNINYDLFGPIPNVKDSKPTRENQESNKKLKRRKNKISQMTAAEKAKAKKDFWDSPSETTFSPEIIAIVFEVSLAWLQKKRCTGGGIPYSKIHFRKVIYQKMDVLNYFNDKKMSHTA